MKTIVLFASFCAAAFSFAAEYDVAVCVNSCPVEVYGDVMAGKINKRACCEKEFSGKIGENGTLVFGDFKKLTDIFLEGAKVLDDSDEQKALAEKTAGQTDKNYDLEVGEKIEISLDKRKESDREVFIASIKAVVREFEGFVDANAAVGDPPAPNPDGILIPMYSTMAFEKSDFVSGSNFSLNTAPVLFERTQYVGVIVVGCKKTPRMAEVPSYRWISVKITKAQSSEK